MFAWLKSLWPSPARRAERNLEALSTLVLSQDSRARWKAAAALGRTGDPRAVAPLIEALKNPIREHFPASEGGGKDDLPPREAFTRYEETDYIEDALVMLGALAVEPLLELSRSPFAGTYCRQCALRILVKIGDPRSVDAIQAATQEAKRPPTNPPGPVQVGTCSYCNGSGDCYCKRKGLASFDQCVRCNGSGKCNVCKGTGRLGQ